MYKGITMGIHILQRSYSSYSGIWGLSSKTRILSRIGKLRSDIWNFHVGCIYCNIRTEVYEVVELKEKGGDKNGERSFAKGLCKYRKEKIRLHYCKSLWSNLMPVSLSIETSFF